MTAELQNKAWTYLPEEVRDRIKEQYRALEENRQKQDKYNTEYLFAQAQLITIFGKRNLISISGPEEQKPKTPKTWSELVNQDIVDKIILSNILNLRECSDVSPILKAANALLKIHQLIEYGHGGNITNEEWYNTDEKYCIDWSVMNKFRILRTYHSRDLVSFHTKEQAEEFLSYGENVQLLKDHFMV